MSKKTDNEIRDDRANDLKKIEEVYGATPAKYDMYGKDKSGKARVLATSVSMAQEQSIVGNVLEMLKKNRDVDAIQLSFSEDPKKVNQYSNIFKNRNQLIPNDILKRIRDTEELIGGVLLPVRSRQASLFARPRANRFDVGFELNLKPHIEGKLSDEEKKKIKEEIFPVLRELLLNCGHNSGLNDKEKRTLGQYFMEIVEDWLTFGAFATEVRDDEDGKFHSFRAADTGTMYFTVPQKDGDEKQAEQVRAAAARLLATVNDTSGPISVTKFMEDEYTYVQVIDNQPVQVFTDKEMLYWTGAPSTDIYRSGYPVSPIERILSAVSTHINLTTHNKLFFVNGRAARNVLVFKSETLEEEDINTIRSQMAAHINSAGASWRMPVFGLGPQDAVEVVALDGANRDMEFQYLADLNKRMIFAAYQMSPDEVSALSYLSRGTNSQAMSESNNEWKMSAARDTGLRPLLLQLEDFLNARLLPRINSEWSSMIRINLAGLDAESPEKESSRLQQDSALYLTMNDIMSKVENDLVPIGGELPLNPAYLAVIEKYYTKGQILKAFGGEEFKEADKNPDFQYYMGDPVWLQLHQEKLQMQMQQQQMQAAQQAQPGGAQPGQPGEQPQDGQQQAPGNDQGSEDLDSALAQLQESLNKSEKVLPTSRREMLKKFKIIKANIMKSYEAESKKIQDELLSNLEKTEHENCDHEDK